MINRLLIATALTTTAVFGQLPVPPLGPVHPGQGPFQGVIHPAGLQPGEQYRILFATDSRRDAMSSNIADYDAFVTADANASPGLAAMNVNWRAVASTPAVSARVHTETEGTGGVAIYGPTGFKIADDYGHLWGTSTVNLLHAGPAATASGNPAGAAWQTDVVWTGTSADGSSAPRSLGDPSAIVGAPVSPADFWVLYGSRQTSEQHRLYGISDVITVQASLPQDLQPGQQYRILVATDSTRDAISADIADYDAFVSADVQTSPILAALNTTWRAFATTSSVHASVHAEIGHSGGVPIYRADGIRMADDYAQFWNAWGTPLQARPWVTASGLVTRSERCWIGATAQPMGSTGNVRVGDPTLMSSWLSNGSRPATEEFPLFGISEVLTVPYPPPQHPAELQPGDQYRVLMVTDGVRDATSTDIADYDAFVTADAQASVPLASLQTTWQALASTASTNAQSHTATTGTGGVPIFRPDGVRLADDYPGLWSHNLLTTPTVTPSGASIAGSVWTGSDLSGTANQPLGSPGGSTTVGVAHGIGPLWIAGGTSGNTAERRLYGISAVITVPYPAVEDIRPGDPANPIALLRGQTSRPVIGNTWDPVIDHTTFVTNAALDFAMFGGAQLNVPVPNLGTVLTDQTFGSLAVTPGQPFLLALPNNADLLGLQLSVQGLTLDWTWGLHLTNALDITVGTH